MMTRNRTHLYAAIVFVLLGLGGWYAAPAAAGVGDSPTEGQILLATGFQVVTWLQPGQRRWYQVPYPGGGVPLAITLHLRAEDSDVRNAVNLSVNVYMVGGVKRGEADVEWRGYGRIGFASSTAESGENRKFWFNNSGEGEMYFVLVRNDAPRAGPIAVTVRQRTDPSPYMLLTSDAPAPEPTPIPAPVPVPTASPVPEPSAMPAPRRTTAEAFAELIDTDGNDVGVAHLTEEGDGVRIEVEAGGLTPGLHGIAIHAVGSCEPPTFNSAGPHFNPEGRQHGLENPGGPHAGDLPNLLADTRGDAVYEVRTDWVTLGSGPYSLLDDGSAIVIHAQPDDGRTDPDGNTGDGVVCGVIGAE